MAFRATGIHSILILAGMLGCLVAAPAGVANPARATQLSGMDSSIPPGDDFFRYANGAWLKQTPMPADQTDIGLLQTMVAHTRWQLRELVESAARHAGHQPASLDGKVGAFYRSFMDETKRDASGFAPIAPQLNTLRQATTREALAALMGRQNADFNGSLFSLTIDSDQQHPTRYVVYISQAGLGLPDRDYYMQPAFARQKAAYQAYVSRLLKLAHWSHSEAAARDVVAFETGIAQASWSVSEQRDPVASFNPTDVAGLAQLAPGFDWHGFLHAADLGDVTRVVVVEKSALFRLAQLYARTPVATLQAWQAVRMIDNAAFYLSRPFQDAYFSLHGRTLTGQRAPSPRWQRALLAVSGSDCGERLGCFGTLSWAVGQLYEAKYFPPAAKVAAARLVDDLIDSYRARIAQLDWMSDATRREALRKLDTYAVKIGGPDHLRDYGAVVIRDDDLVGNVLRTAKADWAFERQHLLHPVDRYEWRVETPQTVDANNGTLRDIELPAALLQPPLFDPHADAAVNYGAIGAFIGHELTHGFDDQGRATDADGVLRDWWTPSDAKAFGQRTARLGAQYSSYQALPGLHLDGQQTMGENIADLGGVTLALQAYHHSLAGQPAPVVDGFSGDQRLFLSWAWMWRGKRTQEALREQVASEVHSPYVFRVNGVVRNIDAWYQAFNVVPGDKLYLVPAARVRIW